VLSFRIFFNIILEYRNEKKFYLSRSVLLSISSNFFGRVKAKNNNDIIEQTKIERIYSRYIVQSYHDVITKDFISICDR
jgi:hypothetical protein